MVRLVKLGSAGQRDAEKRIRTEFVSHYDAKTRLSVLMDCASAGEEIVIAYAWLVPNAQTGQRRAPAIAMNIKDVADDFDASDPRIEQLFSA